MSVLAALKLTDEDVVLNPFGNSPMQRFASSRDELSHISGPNWRPRLVLNSRQTEINTHTGTVLLLGRSGTGKTKYLSERMASDRERDTRDTKDVAGAPDAHNPPRQLFVCRSLALRDLVKCFQEERSGVENLSQVSFLTLDKVRGHILGTYSLLASYPYFLTSTPLSTVPVAYE